MGRKVGRRQFLSGIGATVGLSSVAGIARSTNTRTKPKPHRRRSLNHFSDTDAPVDVRGAIYIPAHAFNHYQMWRDYDPDIIERDLGYAASLNLNAIRTWLSYEYWLVNPEDMRKSLEHLLNTARRYGIKVLLGLFDSVGTEPTFENIVDHDPRTAVQTFSPSTRTEKNDELWDVPREYIFWVMHRYKDDKRLLALELTNEPGWNPKDVTFFKNVVDTFTFYRGDVPLTIGSTSFSNNVEYLEWGMDILQVHYNFARTPAIYNRFLQQAANLEDKLNRPVWLSEWQRIRPGDKFFADVPASAAVPNYSSLAPIIQSWGVGNFFWSLMLKPAFSPPLRQHGVLNGLFHEDGAVWSLDDARSIKAMSGDPSFDGTERREYPGWAAVIKGDENQAPESKRRKY